MTDRASSLSRLVLTVFRLNGGLLEAGDALVRDIGLTSARWQVLGASAEHGAPQTVSQIARTMGLTRQAVQRLDDELHRAGLIVFFPTPDHARAKLMDITDQSQDTYAEALPRHRPWDAAFAAEIGRPRGRGRTCQSLWNAEGPGTI